MTHRNKPVPEQYREDDSDGYYRPPSYLYPYERDVEFLRDYDSSTPHWLCDEHGNPINGPHRPRKENY